MDGTPGPIFYAFFGGILPVSFLHHAYRHTGFDPFYRLPGWPKPLP